MSMSNRAYALLTVKSIDEDQRIIRGVATTPEADRVGDIVEPLGVVFNNPLPLLWQHKHDKPIGLATFHKPTKNGIEFEATLPKIDEPGTLKDRVDEAWQSIKSKLVRGVSIGFRAIEHAVMKDGGYRFLKTEVLELSLVTIAANISATIQTVKSVDQTLLAASGHRQQSVDTTSAGASATKHNPVVKAQEAKRTMSKKPISEQISGFENERAAKAAALQTLQDTAGDEGRTKDATEKESFDTLQSEIKAIDDELVDLRVLEKINVSKAVVVNGSDTEAASQTRNGVVVQVKGNNLPKGTAFTRYVIALARSKGNIMMAHEIANQDQEWKDTTPEVAKVLKAAVAAGTTTDATWAAPLVEYQVMASEFIDLLRPMTIIGRLPGLRRVPFNIKMPGQTGGSTVGWVGEGNPKPVSALAFETITMRWAKIAGIVVLTDELVRFSSPAAEALVRQDLAEAITQFMDREFVDPTKAAVTNVSPASITNGITPVTATGTTSAAFRADVKTLFGTFLAANLSVAGAVWIMTETSALSLSLMQNALGQPEFPGLTMTGGTLLGLPVVTSENIPATGGSPANGALIILAKTSEIMLADDGGVTIDASREASLQMDGAPDSPSTASTNMVSLWQTNRIGLRAERIINWQRRRDEAVGFIEAALYSE